MCALHRSLSQKIEISLAGSGLDNSERAHSRDARTIQTLECDTAQQKREIESLLEELEGGRKNFALARQQDQQTILSLTDDLNAYQDMQLEKDQEIQQLNHRLEETRQTLVNLEDLNDELRVSQSSSNAPSGPTSSKSLADELNPSDSNGTSSQEDVAALLAKIQDLKDDKLALEQHLRNCGVLEEELHDFNQLNSDLRGLNASFQRERAQTTRIIAENEALRELYKGLQLKLIRKSSNSFMKEYKQLKSNYEDAKEYAEEMELTTRTLQMRIRTLEQELKGVRDDYGNQVNTPQKMDRWHTPASPSAHVVKSPRGPQAGVTRTLQTVIDVQQAKVAESEAGKKLIEWKLDNSLAELARQKEFNTQLSVKLATSDQKRTELVALFASKKEDGNEREATGGEVTPTTNEGTRAADMISKSRMQTKMKQAIRRANDRIMSLESEMMITSGENTDLRTKVSRLQSRLHRLRSQQVGRDEHHARPIPGGVVESLDKLIADVHQSNSPKIPPNSRSRIKWTPARAASAAFVTPPSTPKTLVADDSVAGSNKRTEKQQQPDHIMQNHSVYLHRAPNGLRNSLDISKLPPPKERAHRQPSPAAARARPKLHAPRLPDNGRSLTISKPSACVQCVATWRWPCERRQQHASARLCRVHCTVAQAPHSSETLINMYWLLVPFRQTFTSCHMCCCPFGRR